MEHLTDTMIVCPDQSTSRYITSAVGQNKTCEVVLSKRDIDKRIEQWIQTVRRPILVLVPAESPSADWIHSTRLVEQCNGITLVWALNAAYRDDRWILLQLLEAEGALICSSLDILAQVAHLFRQTDGAFTHIQQTTAKSVVMTHIMNSAAPFLTTSARKTIPKVKINKSAHLVVEWKKKEIALQASPSIIGESLIQLCRRARRKQSDSMPPVVTLDTGAIKMVARPPARILSETTSKRLLRAFGLQTPTETLCESPSQAVRCAKLLNGPATLKLVRPNFRFKSMAGAVIQDASGPSEIQKAYQSLMTLSEQLGAPKALGILVSEQIDTPHLFWIEARKHSQFGRIILFGKRDDITEKPDGALLDTCTYQQCQFAVSNTYPDLDTFHASSLAQAIFRFAVMCRELNNHIGLAQIHPLALTETGALMLDAIVGITDAPVR
ncbi:MAG: acetate--CoA ligase family protein [Deltaproteobacteria bacterium]|nr:acetate--CoA ligase family protein [Deltaproteobacteria bacterium]MBN2674137.1 acetate--CoA ligase family protein [Deltaproteobacteria bacterium]